MTFIAICVGIIAVAALPEFVRVALAILIAICKVVGYLLAFAFIVGVTIWMI